MTLLGPRRRLFERIDAPGVDPERLARSHRRVEAVNRWLGGNRALRLHLRDLRDVAPLRLLDVGTGNGGALVHLRRWSREAGGGWRLVGLDAHPSAVRIARRRTRDEEGAAVIRGDGLRLPVLPATFDVAFSVLTLHHFPGETARELLREMGRVARRRVLVSELERCVANYAGAKLLAATVWRTDPLTRHDGPVSVLRAFTPAELRAAGEDAGLLDVTVTRHLPFRLVLEARPPPPAAGGRRTGSARAREAAPGRGGGRPDSDRAPEAAPGPGEEMP